MLHHALWLQQYMPLPITLSNSYPCVFSMLGCIQQMHLRVASVAIPMHARTFRDAHTHSLIGVPIHPRARIHVEI